MSTFRCENCGINLSAPADSAGKQTRCTECGDIQVIPGAQVKSAPISTEGSWYVKTVSDDVYGPARFEELRDWVAEGRIVDGCSLREPETRKWIDAGIFFPKLAAAPVQENDRSFAETTYGSEAPTVEEPSEVKAKDEITGSEPVSRTVAPPVESVTPRSNSSIPSPPTTIDPPPVVEDHRGLTVLLLGVFGFLLTCPVFSFFAWQMGASDLQKMDANEMDRSGREMTAAGHLLGKIHLVIFAIGAAFLLISLLLASS